MCITTSGRHVCEAALDIFPQSPNPLLTLWPRCLPCGCCSGPSSDSTAWPRVCLQSTLRISGHTNTLQHKVQVLLRSKLHDNLQVLQSHLRMYSHTQQHQS